MAENQNSREFTTRERCAALISEDNTYDGLAAVTAQRQNYNAIRTLDGASPVVTATITDGALPLTGSARILVDTEGQAPADDLETIPVSGTDAASGTVALCPDGAIIYLKAKNAARAVTVKNTSNVNGIQTYSGNNVVLSAKAWTSFQLQDGTWRQCVATDSENLMISSQYVKTSGNQTIAGAKTFSSAITASVSGNAGTATKLQTARTINGVSFDGTANISITCVLAGMVLPFAASSAPSGYLVCNGAAVSRTTYANLFKAIGTTWGVGNGSTTFNLPNYIGRFLEGATTAGQYKNAGLPNIAGVALNVRPRAVTESSQDSALQWSEQTVGEIGAAGFGTSNANLELDASKSNSIYGKSTTVQPASATVLPCIKY